MMFGSNLAQQKMPVELGASLGGVPLIINSYTLVLASLLMPVGAFGDRWGGTLIHCSTFPHLRIAASHPEWQRF